MTNKENDPAVDLARVIDDPPDQPMELFARWHALAAADPSIRYAAAACLSTVDDAGFPDGRTVLIKRFETAGFLIFSDVDSAKGRALSNTAKAALTFYWGPLERQVRIKGTVEQAAAEDSDACFAQRPRESQITAWVSRQSQAIENPASIQASFQEYQKLFAGEQQVPRPSNWAAFWIIPKQIEFWQAAEKRLHHRLLYSRTKLGWTTTRLYP